MSSHSAVAIADDVLEGALSANMSASRTTSKFEQPLKVNRLRFFREYFKPSLAIACAVYPEAKIDITERGKVAFLGICSGCHIYNGRMIGPAVQVIQALYLDNPQGIADYIAKPVKKRPDYPEMPPQDYLHPETRLAFAEYMLAVKN